jgi:activating signal cointegrator complex subunit 3
VELVESECIKIDEDETITPEFLGYIASFYYIAPSTCRLFKNNLLNNPEINFEQLLRLLSDATEFEEIPVRHNEDQVNDELSKMVSLPVDRFTLDSPHTKTFLLIQAHLHRTNFPITDYITDAKLVIDSATRVIYAMADIAAEYSTLHNTLKVTTILQMMV